MAFRKSLLLWGCVRTLHRHWMPLALALTLAYLYFVIDDLQRAEEFYEYDYDMVNDFQEVKNGQCQFPVLDLMPPEFEQYFQPKDIKTTECSKEKNWVTISQGIIKIAPETVKKYGKGIQCQAVPITRIDDFTVGLAKEHIRVNEASAYGTAVKSDFMEVTCQSRKGHVYKNVHSTVHVPPSMPMKTSFPDGGMGLNVMIYGFDSVSRMNWMRNMKKTHSYFTSVMEGIILKGYNIVGDGTPQNLMPILTGKSELELAPVRRGEAGAAPLDNKPWIFKDFQKAGYVTQYGEDGAQYGTFQFRMLGFDDPPTDHYMRPFYVYAESVYHKHHPWCLGSTPRHLNMMNYVKDFFYMYQDVPKFSFLFHSELSHGFVNSLQMADNDMRDFLSHMHSNGYLDNTLVILMSDHGARYAELRSTVQGKYEERLPYIGIYLPLKIREKYPHLWSNLKANVDKLTTPFDLHETIKGVLDINSVLGDTNFVDSKGNLPRGINLFKKIPDSRTCDQADIAPHWCTCLQWQPIRKDDDNVKAATWALMNQINDFTAIHRTLCHELTVLKIIKVDVYMPDSKLLKFKQSADIDGRILDLSDNTLVKEALYQITVQTSPNNGLYEATIKHLLYENKFKVDVAQISRINLYGDQPKCIMKELPHLRPFCMCKVVEDKQ